MTFDELLAQVRDLLQREGRVSYRALKRRFTIDGEYIEDLKAELIDAKHLAFDEDGKVLVWTGDGINGETDKREKGKTEVISCQLSVVSPQPLAPNPQPIAAERRQLTVMFCDLVGSTALSEQLDPEDYRAVVQAYQETCTEVIRRYDGHIAQHLGDGLLVYFGYPVAHEDDAVRAVRAGLEIITALRFQIPSPLAGEGQGEGAKERILRVRLGIHTGLVVIGEVGNSEKREMLALGETPNIAARVQGQARPNEVMISAATYHLVEGLFECEDRGQPELKGVTTPLTLYHVCTESTAHSRFETALQKGLTPLVGREEEFALLRRRWEQAKEGEGQIVLLSGEAGIGKSRLVQEMKEPVSTEGATRIEFHCSPYHQNSAFYPILDHLQRLLQFAPDDNPQSKLAKLQHALTQYSFPQAETLPLLAALLSLPLPDGVQSLTWSPQKQKEKTQETLVAWMIEETTRQAVYLVWEDLHWIDPSSLEVLTLVLQQIPTSRALVVLTHRPDFTPPWRPRAHSTQLTLSRLGRQHVTDMVNQVVATAVLSDEVIRQIVSRTDGVPLFVEELTKSVAESVGAHGRASLPSSAIPTTLQDSLMARLDRLGAAKTIAQLGATLGREFSYDLLQAVSPLDATALQHALQQLIDAELLYQRGLPPQVTYLFKHALIQDTAYQSLLKSTRQQYHKKIAQVLEERFPDTKEAQPELLAHHYSEAGLIAHALPYWQKAGERASQRSAYVEAISYLTRGLELLETLPDAPERPLQELTLQSALGRALMATKGYSAPAVGKVYARARELCSRLGETPQLFPVLWGLSAFYIVRGELQPAHEVAQQIMDLARSVQDPALLLEAHNILGNVLFILGEIAPAREHVEQGIALYDPQQHHSHAFLYGHDPGVSCLGYAAYALWCLGYPDQALRKSKEALALAQGLSHPYSLAYAQLIGSRLHLLRQEKPIAQIQAEALISTSAEQGFAFMLALGTILRGSALAIEEQAREGIAQIHQGLTAFNAMGAELYTRAYFLALLAEAYGRTGQWAEELSVLAEALAFVDKTGERVWEAELYRLKGELSLQSRQVKTGQDKSEDTDPRPLAPDPQGEAEACFLKAIEIAQKQQAKSLELRAATSLARLWQQRSKRAEAHKLLSEVYNWFTEGFDTKDLQEAKALIEDLGETGKWGNG